MTTPHTTTFKRGDIVLVPFHFVDRTGIKQRPALVLISPSFLARRQDVVVAAITSRIRGPLLFDDYHLGDFRAAGFLQERRSP